MEQYYLVLLAFLGVIAVIDLFVGVSNDAVNFLNSALGCRISSFRTTLWVASIGVLAGATFSSGMMEIARHGIFRPEQFFFQELVCIFLAVMVTDVLVLDVFNTLGLPTSTTVSMVFELLGGTFALTLVKMAGTEGMHFADYLNTEKALSVIMGIFLSVAIAFFFGMVVQWLARLVFTFRYRERLKWTIGLFGGIASTAIVYFMLIKGVKDTTFMTSGAKAWIAAHGTLIAGCCLVGFTLLMQVLHWLRVNVFKVVVLLGTFALALAFAGNDLVNFIGVPLAGYDSYLDYAAHGAGSDTYLMSSLNEPARTPFLFLAAAGVIMVWTLCTSKKAQKVIKTSVDLSRQDEGEEMFGSSAVARSIVRTSMSLAQTLSNITPPRMRAWINARFSQDEAVLADGAAFDLVRASVNLLLASLLIALGTSLKLPLSTTYVTFMVAMGSSLADKAWGRESAVYRITGVVTVIAGWFVTALIAFVIALVVTYALLWGGTWAVIIISLLCVGMFIQSSITHKRRKAKEHKTEEIVTASGNSTQEVMRNLIAEISGVMTKTTEIYSKTIMATLNEDRRTLREMVRESNDLFYNAREKKYALLPTLQKLQDNYIEAGHFYVQVVDYISERSKALVHITRPCFEHIDNNHKGMSEEQVEDLLKINDKVSEIYARINVMLNDNDYSDTNVVLEMRDELFVTIDDAVKSQLRRIQNKATSTKASMLYLTILNETKTMVLQSRNLLKSQRSFMENQDTSNDLMGNK